MARTSQTEVAKVIEVDSDLWDDAFANNASVLVDRLSTTATANGFTLSSDELTLIETYVAAHMYALRDQQYKSKKTDQASATFQTGTSGKGLESTDWGQMAIALDPSGELKNLTKKVRVSTLWLGTPESEVT